MKRLGPPGPSHAHVRVKLFYLILEPKRAYGGLARQGSFWVSRNKQSEWGCCYEILPSRLLSILRKHLNFAYKFAVIRVPHNPRVRWMPVSHVRESTVSPLR